MTDPVNPDHYETGWSDGARLIQITENLNFNRGNAVKYIARAGSKDPSKEIEDLHKAKWYLDRELYRLGEGVRDRILDAKVRAEIPDEELFYMTKPVQT